MNYENIMIIVKLSKGDNFSFYQRRQNIIKGRIFSYIERIGKVCYYSELNSNEILQTNWNREIIKHDK